MEQKIQQIEEDLPTEDSIDIEALRDTLKVGSPRIQLWTELTTSRQSAKNSSVYELRFLAGLNSRTSWKPMSKSRGRREIKRRQLGKTLNRPVSEATSVLPCPHLTRLVPSFWKADFQAALQRLSLDHTEKKRELESCKSVVAKLAADNRPAVAKKEAVAAELEVGLGNTSVSAKLTVRQ